MTALAHRTERSRSAEKSDAALECGEIHAPAARERDAGLIAMNILHTPVLPAKRRRKRSDVSQTARLELTLEMPRHRPPVEQDAATASEEEPARGVADIDFYI